MAMTKAEKARMDELEAAVKLARSMRWPEYPEPATLTKSEIQDRREPGGERYGSRQMVARGWFGNSFDQGRVSYGCSDGNNHSPSGDTTDTQGVGHMYPSEADAWRAIRHKMTFKFAKILARVDDEIARSSSLLDAERQPI